MKKTLCLLLAALMLAPALAACGETEPETDASAADTSVQTETEETEPRLLDDLPDGIDLAGWNVNVLSGAHPTVCYDEICVDEMTGDVINDAVYSRNLAVENRLNVKITDYVVREHGESGRPDFDGHDTLTTLVTAGDTTYNLYTSNSYTTAALGYNHILHNLKEVENLNLTKPYWAQYINETATVNGQQYLCTGPMSLGYFRFNTAMVFNKRLFLDNSIEYPYQTVLDGKWTLDAVNTIAEQIYADTNGDGVVSDGDVVGLTSTAPDYSQSWFEAWIPALGISYTTMNHGIPELSFYSERTVGAFEQLGRLIASNPGTLAKNELVETKFVDGKALFGMTNLNAGSGLRDMKDAYGVLPLPMLNEEQGEYRTSFGNVASLVTILSSLPNDRKELVGATLELMAAESYKQVTPAYFEIAVKTKYAESPEDAQIYDLILNATTFSFGACYGTESIKGAGNQNPITVLFRRVDRDLVQLWEENVEAYEQSLEKLINGLDEAAFNAMMG